MALFQGVGHIAIFTKDLEMSIAFYEKLGGELLNRGEPFPGKKLALVSFCGVTLELLQASDAVEQEGTICHFAIAVEDVEAAMAELRAKGLDTFETETKTVMPELFGGLENCFFRGPGGERIELLKMLH